MIALYYIVKRKVLIMTSVMFGITFDMFLPFRYKTNAICRVGWTRVLLLYHRINKHWLHVLSFVGREREVKERE